MELTRAWVSEVTDGSSAGPATIEPVGIGVGFDSRTLRSGEVFAALRDVRDGHEYVAAAHERGAAFSIVDRPVAGYPVVEVADVREALRRLGNAARDQMTGRVVGITGSVGKTSTKDFTAAALGAALVTHAAPASFNNDIGVPVTLLGAPNDVDVVVVEMGARFAGNIADLCAIARPDIGVITNMGITHAEHLGGPEGVAAVKGELLEALPPDGVAVLSADCATSLTHRERTLARVITVGTEATADVAVEDVVVDAELRVRFRLRTPWGSGPVALGARGAHQAINAAQAATVALVAGVGFDPVVAALASAEVTGWRMRLEQSPSGVVVLNDSYNASPVAMEAAVEALAAFPVSGRHIGVLGEMRELGEWSDEQHAAVGRVCARTHLDVLIAVGPAAAPLADAATAGGVTVHRVADAAEARELVCDLAGPGDAVLVKASRALGLEVVVAALVGTEAVA